MPTLTQLRPEYRRLLDAMHHTRRSQSEAAADKIFRNSARYIQSAAGTPVPWPFIGVLDLRESDCDPRAALGQGDPWNQRSTHVPKGKGPFGSYVEAAKFYMHYDGLDDPPAPYDMEVVCYMGEKWNGFGPRNHGINTGYLWAGTNNYDHGKYVADGVWSASAVDQQLGIIPVLAVMFEKDPSIYIAGGNGTGGDDGRYVSPLDFTGIKWIQSRLNVLMVANNPNPELLDLLVVDGNYGRQTTAVVRSFQTWRGITADGQAGPETTAEMDKALTEIK